MFGTYVIFFCCRLISDLLETITRKLQPETSIFICGDFNFALGRNNFKEVLRLYNADILPQVRLSARKEPIDYVLVRSTGSQIESHEFDVTCDDADIKVKREPTPGSLYLY